jgi:hypothetical protein
MDWACSKNGIVKIIEESKPGWPEIKWYTLTFGLL